MKIVLIGPQIEENLSLGYLKSALLRGGHLATIVPFNRRADLRRVVRTTLRSRAGLIGLSLVAQRRYPDFQELAELLRRNGFRGHVTAGGHFASLRADEVLGDTPGIDTILHHDGEDRIVALADGLASGGTVPLELDGVSWRAKDGSVGRRPARRVADVDALAFPWRCPPTRTLGYARAPIVSSRGCSGACSFCSIHAWHRQVPTGRLRFRSPANTTEEMISLHRNHGVRVFIFHDDDFVHPDPREARNRSRKMLDAAERGIGEPFAFVIKCRPDRVDADLFGYLKSKGLVRVYVGIETHSDLGIRTLNRRVSPGTNERALSTLRQLGIYACFNLLLFHPDTTIGELDENLAFLASHRSYPFDLARTELYARSALEERMLREGRAIGDYRGYDYRIADPVAESVFRLFAGILWERHFGDPSILHRVQDLGFRLSLLRRFHPDLVSPDLEARMESLIEDLNSDTVGYMRRLAAAALGGIGPAAGEPRTAFAEAMRREVAANVRKQSVRWAALSLEIEGRALLGRAGLARFPAVADWPRHLGRAAAAVPWVALSLGPLSCSECQNGTVCDPAPPPIRFSAEIKPELDRTCATSGCHSESDAAAGLVLASGSSYENLVGAPSTQAPGMNRVEPGDPSRSYLIHKLQGTQADVGGSGERMPKGAEPAGTFTEVVRLWIGEGATEE